MRIRIALTLGALVLAGGALTGGIALASEAQAPAAPTQTQSTRPGEPTVAPVPATSRPRPQAPSAVPVPRETTRPARTGPAPRVPRAVPAGPTGDLHLPAVWETR
ncbi:hypothetical protein AMES_0346 [Amycolatopsis mediterranei S699]|uniref:hypothetical protein n=1 Tax=Amycolatopsis mediterranei TaxID=33910 RepID=UPI000274B7D1|nr:hypothetical protein [Amycolatopsis mediterranei]AFO73882.1 hypothetical protein AMES_0346 [Amycolatopsis mediterranei S699]AGT81011.1 hypothetical protein B737_0347 [Amycolatopsis mediterranei RB]KDO07498.1 hypothetical protein DV26_28155 [Amycolatopsis mediterranei]KDU89407.1 hypothetical protein DV36_25295 [Amycolatopsis mediterranei]UZF67347.1 hypothetical protein ISP_000345 [Amycolatopsis mediterranei]